MTFATQEQEQSQIGFKAFRGSTHRLVSPEETVARVLPLLPVMGITRIANVTGLDHIGVPVVVVCRPNSRSLAVSQGKGLDLAAAKASALMESIEAYHAEKISLPVRLGSFEELRYTNTMIDVEQLPRCRGRSFHKHMPLIWIAASDIMNGEPVLLPYETVHTDYTFSFRIGAGVFNATSNGLASGNHFWEAVSHGICEVIERDATTLWYLRSPESQESTRIDLDSVDHPGCLEVLNRFARANILCGLWETTTDTGVPSFHCTIMNQSDSKVRLMYPTAGMGCHPVRAVAMLRALTEAAQSRLTAIAGSRDDLPRSDYDRYRNPDLLAANRKLLAETRGRRNANEGANFESEYFEHDVHWLMDRLRAVRIERVAVINLTKPEFGIPVVRVVIPGLEGVSLLPEYVPGRRAQVAEALS